MSDYPTLEKLFYSDSSSERVEHGKAEAERRLNNPASFRTGIELSSGELFLATPRELSLLNEKMLRAERKVSQLWRDLPGIARWAYLRSLIMDEIMFTNEMEGVHSSRRQIEEALESAEAKRPKKEAKRFREFASLYLELTDSNHVYPQTPADIRAIYDKVVADAIDDRDLPDGKLFRAGLVDVKSASQKTLHTGVGPESKIVEMIDRMIELVASPDIPQTYSAILSHFLFEYIHPFYDGNGRTGRYLLALYLSEPLSETTVLSLSRVIAENKSKYYKAFDVTERPMNHAEATFFVMQIIELIRLAQDSLIESIELKRMQLDAACACMGRLASECELTDMAVNVLFVMAQFHLFGAFSEASLKDIAGNLEVSTQTARRYLQELEGKGLIATVSRKPLKFVLSDKTVEALEMPAA